MLEYFILLIGLFFGLIIARLNYLYGRSAVEANEYGGDFIPISIKNLFNKYIFKLTSIHEPCLTRFKC
jgi:hypothetical protein